ncbi:MAG: HypC/HybG/HupF family hydrogenase formation chaperone [Planctomycetaceae bacterium]|nr:HypC/HybG/HupF family hydrogenase formation chaperone [Planctomycetaceae bacterium]
MCLAVPGRIVRWIDRDATFAQAEIEFDGVRRTCHMACVAEAEVGDYVIVHAGVAISRVDEQHAQQTLADLARLGELDQDSESQL